MKRLLLILGSIIVLGVAWYLVSPLWRVKMLNETSPVGHQTLSQDMPAQASVLTQASFIARAHDVAGQALLIAQENKKILRFEDFETINGPNLHIYLSADFEGKDYVDLGAIRATKGSANYEIPSSVDTAKYRHVLVWCVPFGVLFSSASLE